MSIDLTLKKGSHPSPEEGMCAMEAAAWLAGDKHTDAPKCVSPVVRRYMIRLNDRLNDEDRQRLRPYVLRALGTAGDGQDEERVRLCTKFVLRESLPFWLRAAGLDAEAARVERLETWDDTVLAEVRDAARRVRDDKWGTWVQRRDRIRALVLEKLKDQPAAVADAGADAGAVAVADAVAVAAASYDEVYEAAYAAATASYQRVFDEAFPGRTDRAFDLLDRLVPITPLLAPVPDRARLVEGWVAA